MKVQEYLGDKRSLFGERSHHFKTNASAYSGGKFFFQVPNNIKTGIYSVIV